MPKFNNPILPKGADPWVTLHDGWYYYCFSAWDSIHVSRARNLYELEGAETCCVWTPPEGMAYSRELWAPELHCIDGCWFIYVAADDGDNSNHRMYVLRGKLPDPLRGFELIGKISDDTDKWAIDGTVLQHRSRLYFVWSGWEGEKNIAQHLYIAPMSNPWTISGKR